MVQTILQMIESGEELEEEDVFFFMLELKELEYIRMKQKGDHKELRTLWGKSEEELDIEKIKGDGEPAPEQMLKEESQLKSDSYKNLEQENKSETHNSRLEIKDEEHLPQTKLEVIKVTNLEISKLENEPSVREVVKLDVVSKGTQVSSKELFKENSALIKNCSRTNLNMFSKKILLLSEMKNGDSLGQERKKMETPDLKVEASNKHRTMEETYRERIRRIYGSDMTGRGRNRKMSRCLRPKELWDRDKEEEEEEGMQFTCLYCGDLNHYLTECQEFFTKDCYICGKEGHEVYVCEEARKLINKLPYCPQCKAIGHLLTQCHEQGKMSIGLDYLVPLSKGGRRSEAKEVAKNIYK